MRYNEFLQELESKGIRLTFSAGKIRYTGPENQITGEIISYLKLFKGKLIQTLWPAACKNLIPNKTEGEKVPVFVIHGEKATYKIVQLLDPDQPLYSFLHYGSSGERFSIPTLETLAQDYISQMKQVFPDGPFLLIGFSFGGVIAYEIALQLQKKGLQVPLLIMVDSVSPLAIENKFLILMRTLYRHVIYPGKHGFIRAIKWKYCQLLIQNNKTVPVSLRDFYIVNNYKILLRQYYPGKYQGKIILFRSTKNKSTHNYLGWDMLSPDIELIPVEGKHLALFSDPLLHNLIAEQIKNTSQNLNGNMA